MGKKLLEVGLSAIAESVPPIADWVTSTAEGATSIAESDTPIAERVTSIADWATSIAERVTSIAESDTSIAESDTPIAERVTPIAEQSTAIQKNFLCKATKANFIQEPPEPIPPTANCIKPPKSPYDLCGMHTPSNFRGEPFKKIDLGQRELSIELQLKIEGFGHQPPLLCEK